MNFDNLKNYISLYNNNNDAIESIKNENIEDIQKSTINDNNFEKEDNANRLRLVKVYYLNCLLIIKLD